MKQQIKKLLYPLLMAFISIGISFNTEARLPKYMAKRAAELLIEKSELLKDDIALVNADYDVLKPIMLAAISKYITEVNSDDFSKKVITEIEKHEEAIKRFVSVLKDTKIALPAEKTVENISEATKNAVISKLTSDHALNKEAIIRVNKDYDVLKPIMLAAISKYMAEVNSDDFFKKVITEIEKHEEAIEHFVSVLKDTKIVLPAEKTVENISEAMKNTVIAKLISDRAANIVDFLYSTEKRQHLANWMKNRIERGRAKHDAVTDAVGTVQHFTNLFNDIHGGYVDDYNFRVFVNQHFPCWTGTMTCFMLNNEAHKLLIQGNIADSCRIKLGNTVSAYKIVSILFSLELIDNWSDIQRICKNESENPDSRRLRAPERVEEDQYECVPLPNTVYKINESQWWNWRNTQGSCMVSTIHNLLCILCRNEQNGKIEPSENLRQEVRAHLSDLNSIVEGSCNASKKDFVAGTTNSHELSKFAKKIRLDNKYEPTLALFLSTLSNLLHTALYSSTVYHDITVLHGLESECMEHIKSTFPNSRERSQALSEYYGHGFFQSYVQLLAGQDGSSMLTSLFELIIGHLGKINTTLRKWPEVTYQEKTVKDVTLKQNWPEYQLIITDQVVDKTITIGLGHSGGGGQHIEIIDIKRAQT